MELKRPIRLGDKGRDVRACERALFSWSGGQSLQPDGGWGANDDFWCTKFQKDKDIRPATGNVGQPTLNALLLYMDKYSRWLYRGFVIRPPKSDFGPIVQGGATMLLHDCTHITSSLGWPAYDDGFGHAGMKVIAPEDCEVDDNTSGSAGGDAFYVKGKSEMRHWIAHILVVPAEKRFFPKGAVMTTIAAISDFHGGPHVHHAIDARPVLGHHLESHDNYTHGAPLIGVQLESADL